jgi:cell division septum initiation protein DivIVA
LKRPPSNAVVKPVSNNTLIPQGQARENLRGASINVTQLVKRVHRLEVIVAQEDAIDASELYRRAMDKLSASDLDLLVGNTHRLNDPDCTENLKVAAARLNAFLQEERERLLAPPK